jgi:hypothetical protein
MCMSLTPINVSINFHVNRHTHTVTIFTVRSMTAFSIIGFISYILKLIFQRVFVKIAGGQFGVLLTQIQCIIIVEHGTRNSY